MTSKEDFLEWRNLDVTRVVFGSIVERINELATLLSHQAGLNPTEDRFLAGIIHAYREILEVQYEDVEGDKKDA